MSGPAALFGLGRFATADGVPFAGVVRGQAVVPIGELAPDCPPLSDGLVPLLRSWGANLARLKRGLARQGVAWRPLSGLTSFAPLPDARQVFCTGANYRGHVIEMAVALGGPGTEGMDVDQRRAAGKAFVARQIATGAPFIFMKPVTAIAGPNDALELPGFSTKVDWEIELGAVIGVPTYRVSPEEALSSVAGYMVVNDVTARDRLHRTDPGALGPDWIASKGAPGFLPTGPLLVPSEFVPDPQSLRLRLFVNGRTMQDESTGDMTFGVARQIAFLSSFVKLLPGDIICTGSPAGNGIARDIFLMPGDVIEAEIDGLGRQTVHCTREENR